MRVFVTGATGFIGLPVVRELIAAKHKVLGLTRSDEGAKALVAAGAEAHRGTLEDQPSLRSGAAAADAVIHLAFIHDFSKFQENCEIDRQAIETIGAVLSGTGKPLLVTSGLGLLAPPGVVATEANDPPSNAHFPRVSEQTALSFVTKGVRAAAIRLPQVHDTVKQGFVSYVIQAARAKGVSAYIGEGRNRWPAVHVLDAARLYRLALENVEAGAKYHVVGEEGVAMKDIASVIGKGLKIPVVSLPADQAEAHFGWLSTFASLDMPASSARTQKILGWKPKGPGMIKDLQNMKYP